MADKKGEVKWLATPRGQEWQEIQPAVDPKYSKMGERIRHIAPSALQCSMFCGGKQCKYDNPAKWKEEEMAIRGLYSSWITENILAMARPSSYAIREFSVIDQFKAKNITAVMNLQHPGEHASCGFGLEEGGFSYIPQEFMDQDVFFYNFGWDDYGVRALQSILDMVKVMDFALMDGKVAIHCHAGLGRTGVLIACYFVYSQRMGANEAIRTMRASRPKAIQTRGQIACVRDFEKYLRPMWIIFGNTSSEHRPFSLTYFLRRQAHILHGEEERDLRYVPKIVFTACQRLLDLAGIAIELRQISLLKRRGFGASSFTDSSSGSLSTETENKLLPVVSNEQKRNSDSEFLLGHIYNGGDSRDCLIDEDDISINRDFKDKVYFDSNDDESEESVDMDELRPERTLQHSASESILFTNSQSKTKVATDLNCGGQENDLNPSADLFASKSYTELETARASDPDQAYISPNKSINDASKSEFETVCSERRLVKGDKTLLSQDKKDLTERVMFSKQDANENSILKDDNVCNDSAATREVKGYENRKSFVASEERSKRSIESIDIDLDTLTESIATSLSSKSCNGRTSVKVDKYRVDLNNSDKTWDQLAKENDACVLCCLIWNWLEHLEEPVITDNDIALTRNIEDDPVRAFELLDRDKRKTLQVMLFTFLKLTKYSSDLKDKILQKIAATFTRVKTLPRKTRSEKAALITETNSDKEKYAGNYANFLNFIQRLCTSEVFET